MSEVTDGSFELRPILIRVSNEYTGNDYIARTPWGKAFAKKRRILSGFIFVAWAWTGSHQLDSDE